MLGSARVMIVGCGDFGSTLANELSRRGFAVVAIDMREDAFNLLDSDFDGEAVTGDGSIVSVLEECGIEHASYLVAATECETTNFFIAEVASELYGVEHVLPRVEGKTLVGLLDDLNVSPICPRLICVDEFYRLSGLDAGSAVRS